MDQLIGGLSLLYHLCFLHCIRTVRYLSLLDKLVIETVNPGFTLEPFFDKLIGLEVKEINSLPTRIPLLSYFIKR